MGTVLFWDAPAATILRITLGKQKRKTHSRTCEHTLIKSDTGTHTKACVHAPIVLLHLVCFGNRIDGTRGPDCVNVCVSTVSVHTFICASAQFQKPNICNYDAPSSNTHTNTYTQLLNGRRKTYPDWCLLYLLTSDLKYPLSSTLM